jgi:hypothetical protein
VKIEVYVVVHISTDDCTYHCTDFCDVFGSEKEAKDYIQGMCKKRKGWPATHKKEDFEIKRKILDASKESA